MIASDHSTWSSTREPLWRAGIGRDRHYDRDRPDILAMSTQTTATRPPPELNSEFFNIRKLVTTQPIPRDFHNIATLAVSQYDNNNGTGR